ncbi:phosphoglycolate phosphatase [Terrihabitans soli]|uniref:Phosphoglycolate phosphatase n=1 Tax=Terrihabitans soli TaxID=708113 RepID=A0A6S6QX41_9HYPH|nr:HAD hydrolase-like protein [Terrihabitans soli]BCJ91601.1 phosphoglycolate phosphatase [Terrihabitans soli]
MQLAIFDFDGTLADSFPWFCAELNGFAHRHGFREIDAYETEALRSKSTREIMAALKVPMWKLPAIARDMRAHKAEADIKLFNGVPDALTALKERGVVLAMVSSDNEAGIRRTMGAETAALFSHFYCGASLFGKAAKIRKTLKAANIAPENAVYVGDETRDAEAAKQAGTRFAAVLWGYASREALLASSSDLVLERPEDIGKLFRE